MEQVQVKILCQVVTSRHGTLNTGALLRTDAAFAKHLVKDCGAAEYVMAPEEQPAVSGTAAQQKKPPSARKTPAPKEPKTDEGS